jgi:hypothetical protein
MLRVRSSLPSRKHTKRLRPAHFERIGGFHALPFLPVKIRLAGLCNFASVHPFHSLDALKVGGFFIAET